MRTLGLAGAIALLASSHPFAADVGDVVAVITPDPGSIGNFCSIGVAFDGTDLYFDRCGDPLIYRISVVDGSNLGSFDPEIPELPNAMAFDAKRNGLWIGGQLCNGTGMPIYFYDFDTASSVLAFTIPFALINPATGEPFIAICFTDGLAYNENDQGSDLDDEIYFSDDVNRNLALFRPDGTFVAGFDSTTIDASLTSQSGLAVGGPNLYLGNNGGGDVFRAALPAFTFVDQFVSDDERQEDMECDPVTFAPTQVMWVRTTPQGGAFPDVITAYEIEPGTCGLGGGLPNCFTLDFETDDTGDPMPHGAKVDTEFDGGPVFPVTITGVTNDSGDNTVAILNSSTGPAAQDPDLLVGSGNILILQTDANQSECPPASGVYCTHNDDEDGGRINFDFNVPTTPSSIDLIDNDATDQNWRVVLVDGSGNQRIYVVFAGWTGDLVTDGPPGMGTLDLTTLADQPGFASVAEAVEDVGFDPSGVVRIFVEIEGSGGVDNLNWCSPSQLRTFRQRGVDAARDLGVPPHAGAALRNGSGHNPMNLTTVSMPRIGAAWGVQLDCTAFGSGLATLSVRRLPTSGLISPFGEVLVDGHLLYRQNRSFSGAASLMTWQIPFDMSLAGLEVHAQGLCRGTIGASAPKTFQIQGGLSNALDLTLGF